MGEVSLVYDRVVKRFCASKTIHSEFDGVPEALERFQHEVGAAGALDHPNIVACTILAKTLTGRIFVRSSTSLGSVSSASSRPTGRFPQDA